MQIDWLQEKISLPPHVIGLVVFGGQDPETGIGAYHDAFAAAFHKGKNLKCWDAVRAVPPTQACLKSPTVCPDIGDSSLEENMQIAMREMQVANTIAYNLLTVQMFDESMLQDYLKKKQKNEKM